MMAILAGRLALTLNTKRPQQPSSKKQWDQASMEHYDCLTDNVHGCFAISDCFRHCLIGFLSVSLVSKDDHLLHV